MVTTDGLLEAFYACRVGAWEARERRAFRAIRRIRARHRSPSPMDVWIRRSSVTHRLGQFLFALVRARRPTICLETGTGGGISTLYLLAALALNRHGALWSLEGNPDRLALARRHLAAMPYRAPCHLILGRTQDTVPATVRRLRHLDFAFIDDAHQEAAIRQRFPLLQRALRPGGVLVYDDIHWSRGMERGWHAIARRLAPTTTMDCGRVGLVFSSGGRPR